MQTPRRIEARLAEISRQIEQWQASASAFAERSRTFMTTAMGIEVEA
jgi:hypothetical protein